MVYFMVTAMAMGGGGSDIQAWRVSGEKIYMLGRERQYIALTGSSKKLKELGLSDKRFLGICTGLGTVHT